MILGAIEPRLWTPPLRELTPATSYGFDLIEFGRNVVGIEMAPWQEWCSIHAGELLPDGRPRFRTVLILVSRQNGKTTWARVLVLYWLFIELAELDPAEKPFVLSTSTDRSYAKKFWTHVGETITENEWMAAELEEIRLTISEEAIATKVNDVDGEKFGGVEYGFAANNGRAGRSRTLHRGLIDEVREHRNLDAMAAITGAMNAVPYGQLVCISNQGDAGAVLLDSLRDPAVAYIETGEGDPRLGLFEYSSPPGSDPLDVQALAAANPNLGRPHGVDLEALLGQAARAKRAGGEELAAFRTEAMCMRVQLLDPAIDPDLWKDSGTDTPLDLAEHRERVALCLDVSLDGSHASLIAAALVDGVVYIDVVQAWEDLAELRRELPELVRRIRPRTLGWFPNGPAAALAADLAESKSAGWPPRRVELSPLTSETAAVCMALPGLVAAGGLQHPRDPMLDAHVERTQRVRRSDTWVYGRRGSAPIDGTYALAGAVHLARTLPPPRPPLVAL